MTWYLCKECRYIYAYKIAVCPQCGKNEQMRKTTHQELADFFKTPISGG